MPMPPFWRRAALVVHVVSSVGWIGAVAGYVALAIMAAVSADPAAVRAGWLGMELVGWFVIVPLSCLGAITGVLMSLATPWGLVRHYWVLIAFAVTVLSLVVLLLHMPTASATAARARVLDDGMIGGLGQDILHPVVGMTLLVFVAALNVFKPRGTTRWGRRKRV